MEDYDLDNLTLDTLDELVEDNKMGEVSFLRSKVKQRIEEVTRDSLEDEEYKELWQMIHNLTNLTIARCNIEDKQKRNLFIPDSDQETEELKEEVLELLDKLERQKRAREWNREIPTADEDECVLDYSIIGEEKEDGWANVIETGSLILDGEELENKLRHLMEEYGFDIAPKHVNDFWAGGDEIVRESVSDEVTKVKIQVRR
jgi:HD superfamily phosphohydrolase